MPAFLAAFASTYNKFTNQINFHIQNNYKNNNKPITTLKHPSNPANIEHLLVSGVWTSTLMFAVAVTLVVMWDVVGTGDVRLDPLLSDPLQFC